MTTTPPVPTQLDTSNLKDDEVSLMIDGNLVVAKRES